MGTEETIEGLPINDKPVSPLPYDEAVEPSIPSTGAEPVAEAPAAEPAADAPAVIEHPEGSLPAEEPVPVPEPAPAAPTPAPAAPVHPDEDEQEEVIDLPRPEVPSFVKPAIKSQTMRWILVAFLAYLVKEFAIPMMPSNVSNEIIEAMIHIISTLTDVIIPAALFYAARARLKAHQAIEGWVK